jgi:hypothetical protein
LDLEAKIRIFITKYAVQYYMQELDTYKSKEKSDIYEEATSILVELSKSRHRASSVQSRLVQGFMIWWVVLSASLFLSLPTFEYFHDRKAKPELSPINLVSIVVTVISAVNCITLGTAGLKISTTLRRATYNFHNLSDSLRDNVIENNVMENNVMETKL